MRIFSLCFAGIILPIILAGQQSVILRDRDQFLREGLELFEKEKFGAAQELFKKQMSISGDPFGEVTKKATYYHALCAVELFHRDAEYLLTKFIYDYPESPLLKQAWFQLGRFFFRDKKYKNARIWLEKTEPGVLSAGDLEEYYFKLGYTYFKTDASDKSLAAFAEIKEGKSTYASTATYYYGHIQYNNKNYESALEHFKKLESDEIFGRVVPFYISQIYYLQKKYDKVIAYATPVADTIKSRRGPEMAKLLGESYYNTSKYKEALPYLEQYRDKSTAIRTRDDDYQLGFTYFKLEKFSEAAKCFEKATGDQDAIGQNAWYHLGWCNLKVGNKILARNAWREAAKTSFDSLMKEQALFDYAKLAYDLGSDPYDEAVRALQDYMNKYPESSRMDEAYTFLANIYMTTHNYRVALQSIERIKKKTEALKAAYQRVAFFGGIEYLNDRKYPEAVKNFDLSLQYPKEKSLTGLAHYWKAEALYRSEDYLESIKEFKDFVFTLNSFNQKIYNRVNYNLGYAYLKMKDYDNTIVWFRKYLSNSSGDQIKIIQDANIRLGDCYFVKHTNNLAAEYYEKGADLKGPETDYALYQWGIILGLNGKEESKIKALSRLEEEYPSSPYADDAKFEIGKSYQNIGKFDEAYASFESILKLKTANKLAPEALLQMALIRYNQNRDNEAIALYKKVEEDYPGTSSARESREGTKRIYLEQGDQEALKPYLSDKSESSRDSTIWELAEKVYLKGNCEKSLKQLSDYLKDYPEGIFSTEALTYKARCEMDLKKIDEAARSYNTLAERPKNKFTAEALQMLGIYERQKGNFDQAVSHFSNLETMAESKDQLMLALTNLMQIKNLLGHHSESMEYAQKIINNPSSGDDLKNEARMIIARQLYATGNLDESLKEFQNLRKINSEAGAEARYHTALIQHQKGDFERCEKSIFELIDEMPSYDYWLTKGFILLSDNYLKLGNTFQAKRTLQSIIDNHEDDELKETARQKLDAIIQKEESDKQQVTPEEEPISPENNEENPEE